MLGQYIANLLIGTLTPQAAGAPFIIAYSEMLRTNGENITALVNNLLIQIYIGKSFAESVLLLLTDAAPYMVLAGKNLKAIYHNLIHIT